MSKPSSIELAEHFKEFVEAQVANGRYRSADELVNAGLRLLEERESRLAMLRAALIAGEESGPASPFDVGAFIAGKQRKA